MVFPYPNPQVKKRRQEHPYASVGGGAGREGGEEEEDTEEYDTADHLLEAGSEARSSSRGRGTWVPPPRRPEERGGRGASRQTTPLPPEPAPEVHFSGDSQDSFSAKGYINLSVREPLANLARAAVPMEGNYVTLSETSDEMYAAIEDTVYTHPGGAAGDQGTDMYSKVDKAKKRGKSQGREEERPAYATVSKAGGGGAELGARPKQRSPCPPSSEGVDYSEYEVDRVDRREGRSERMEGRSERMETREFYREGGGRDPGYETVPYNEGAEERDPGYEVMPQGRSGTGSRDPEYETLASEQRDPGYESVPQRNRVNSIDPGYEVSNPPHRSFVIILTLFLRRCHKNESLVMPQSMSVGIGDLTLVTRLLWPAERRGEVLRATDLAHSHPMTTSRCSRGSRAMRAWRVEESSTTALSLATRSWGLGEGARHSTVE